MKKKFAKLLICVSMLGLVFSLGACGSDDDSNTGKDTVAQATTPKSQTSSKPYASIEDYVNDPIFQAEVERQMAEYEGKGMSMTITGEGDKLVYTYKYTAEKLIDEDFTLEEAQANFDESIKEQESIFISLCKQLPVYIDVDDPSVVLRYYDYDDTLIWEKEFKAD